MSEKKKRQQINKEELRKKLEEEGKKIIEPTERMGAKLKQLLKKEIEEYKKREKTRVAEMLSIFSAHKSACGNFFLKVIIGIIRF